MKTLGTAGAIVLPLACCTGLPLLITVASGATLALCGAGAFAAALAVVAVLVGLRAFRRRTALSSSSQVLAHDRF